MKINTKWIFAFISVIVLGTICLQLYWNYKSYEINKAELQKEIKLSYEKALITYFEEESKNNFIAIVANDSTANIRDFIKYVKIDSIQIKSWEFLSEIDTSKIDTLKFKKKDGVRKTKSFIINNNSKTDKSISIINGQKAFDSIKDKGEALEHIAISFNNEEFSYPKLDSIFTRELQENKIPLHYNFDHYKNNQLFKTFTKVKDSSGFQTIKPNPTLFRVNETVNLKYSYPKSALLNKMSSELMLSLLFSIAVISCLFFLLHIINKQKKIDIIKNDFISNITHEFKTPITTISSALEGMTIFNPENSLEKNSRYTSIAMLQLKKLEILVEKILETATLEYKKIYLQKEKVNITELLTSVKEKFTLPPSKTITFETPFSEIEYNGDPFHLESVFSNLLDNAIKYGGTSIEIVAQKTSTVIIIDFIDDGNSILSSEEKAVFEKFYRISKGNLHDVKGYGIGLYYAKNIIEKHDGTLTLIRTKLNTTFRITLPYGT